MPLKIDRTFQVKEPVDKVWNILSDPKKVAVCVPGAQISQQLDERFYKGSISITLGARIIDFKGEVQIVRLDPQNHEMEIFGQAHDVKDRGSASMKTITRLRALEFGGTEIISASELNVFGILAELGSRVILGVSDVMFAEFSKNFQARLALPADAPESSSHAEAKPISAASFAFQAARAILRRDS